MDKKLTLNERFTKYFLENSRITLIFFLCLIIFGLISFGTLKITGFPNPDVNFVIVNTLYPGASAQTVEESITKPVESAIKDVDGVESYSSTSQNSVSTTSIELKSGVNYDTASSKISTALQSVQFPDGVDSPKIIKPSISIDDFIYALSTKESDFNINDSYDIITAIKSDLEKDSDIRKVGFANPTALKVLINLDNEKLNKFGIKTSDITNQLKTWNLTIPATQNERIEGKIENITLTISGSSLDDLKNLVIVSAANPRNTMRLAELGDISIQAIPDSKSNNYVGFSENGNSQTYIAQKFTVDAVSGADLSAVEKNTLDKVFDKYFNKDSEEFKKLDDSLKEKLNKYKLITVYNAAEENKKQSDEVFTGLVGGYLKMPSSIPDSLKFLGWGGLLIGGIQLVFLMMLAVVSWRAAIVAAFAIPLSFFFSLIAVKISGNDLNTLVLFSLVLVIGLVVDPALVLLEAIQRKVDDGHDRKLAVLEAVRETGSGLFLAVLTSVLVFVPFGVVSGIFGQIISYIPLTVIPALIASYIVPLAILSWISMKVLKRNKNAKDNEEENLWAAAKWMTNYTKWILQPKWPFVLLRIFIILISLIVPFALAFGFISTGAVKTVQFAQPLDASQLAISVTNYPQQTPEEYGDLNKQIIENTIANKNVLSVSSLSAANAKTATYYVNLKSRDNRENQELAKNIADDLSKKLNEKLSDKVFNLDVNVLSAGPQGVSFPIALAIKNTTNQKEAASDLTEILNKVCETSQNKFEIKSDCDDDKKAILKVDNGYDATSSTFVQVLVKREKTLLYPINPIELKNTISSIYKINNGDKIGTFNQDGEDYDIILESNSEKPNTLDQIKGIQIKTLDGRTITLSTIADISEVNAVAALKRVNGQEVGVVSAKPKAELNSQQAVSTIQELVIKEFNDNYKSKYSSDTVVEVYSEGSSASITKSFTELFVALALAIVLTYIVLVIFFNSFLQPLVILFAIPLTFLGIFPALYYFGGGQLGFLEIIGLIILVGIVENVAIFLIDSANKKIAEGMDDRDAIAYAAGIRFRPIVLTKLTTLVSTLPLAILSDFYRSLSVVIIFGLLTSGIVSLFTSPILYIFFRQISKFGKKLVTRK